MIMKKIWITTIAAFFLSAQAAFSQPTVEWTKVFEGNSAVSQSNINDIIQTADGGFIAVGTGKTSSGNLPSGYIDGTDALIIKMDATGAVQWSKYWGAQEYDQANSVIQTSEGGYIIAGKTNSTFGGMNHGLVDGFVIKLDATGALLWKKLYGGSNNDEIASIRENPDGTFIFAGSTKSPEINGYHGDWDVWIAKLDVNGTIIWENAKGYSDLDKAYSIELAADGGYIVGGNTDSPSATNYHGGTDLWVLKLTAAGAISWQQCIGGTKYERGGIAIEASDGSIMVLGDSYSNDDNAIGNHGAYDLLLAKLNATGTLIYSKMYGGTWDEWASTINDRNSSGIKQTPDGGFVLIGSASSDDGDLSSNNGEFDFWLVKISSLGNIEWQQCIGAAGDDLAHCVRLSSDGGYILAGQYNSQNAWIIKLKNENAGIENLELDAKMNIYPNPTSDILNIEIDWEKAQSSVLTIFDITGRVIHTQPINEKDTIQMDVSKLSGGVYRLSITDDNGNVSTQQFVVGN